MVLLTVFIKLSIKLFCASVTVFKSSLVISISIISKEKSGPCLKLEI